MHTELSTQEKRDKFIAAISQAIKLACSRLKGPDGTITYENANPTFQEKRENSSNAGVFSFLGESRVKTPLTDEESRRLEAIPNLAPGDFRTVSQQLYYLGTTGNGARLAALECESKQKKLLRHAAIGFGTTCRYDVSVRKNHWV